MNRIEKFLIDEKDNGQRVDVFLSQVFPEITRSQLKVSAESGMIAIDDKVVRASRKIKTGETVALLITPLRAYENAAPEAIPLNIVYEDKCLIVIDKPAGMVIHPACGHYTGTLVNAILHHCQDLSGIGGVMRPGIVHRLDKDTSGLLVVAKFDMVHQNLCAQFKDRTVEKKYLTLAWGNMKDDNGEIALPIGRHPLERKLMSTGGKRTKDALTKWRVLERFIVATFLEVVIKTGRTHQIRVHLNALLHPVIGDAAYGKGKYLNAITNTQIRAKVKSCPRQLLHAATLSFAHPVTGQWMSFNSPLPDDMHDFIEFLRDTH